MSYARHVAIIEAADLTPTQYRAARRLLDLCIRPDGEAVPQHLSPDEAMKLCSVGNWAHARRLLKSLDEAKVIEFHSNARAYIRFVAITADDVDRAETARQRADSARQDTDDRAETARQRADSAREEEPDRAEIARESADRAETARQRADSARQDTDDRAETARQRADSARSPHTGARASWQANQLQAGRQDLSTCLPAEGGLGETTPPKADAGPDNPGYRLLTDPEVRLDAHTAKRLAADYDLDELLRQVMRLKRDIETGAARSWGALAPRLKRGFAATITDADRQSDLYLRHAPSPWADAAATWGVDAEEIAEPEPEPASAEPEPDVEPQVAVAMARWAQVLSEFALQQPSSSVDSVLQDSWVIDGDDEHLVVGIADAFRFDWICKKLSPQVRRKLAVIAGHPVELAFQVRPRPSDNKHLSGKETQRR